MSRATLFSLVTPAAACPALPLILMRVSQAAPQHLCAVWCAGTMFASDDSQPVCISLSFGTACCACTGCQSALPLV